MRARWPFKEVRSSGGADRETAYRSPYPLWRSGGKNVGAIYGAPGSSATKKRTRKNGNYKYGKHIDRGPSAVITRVCGNKTGNQAIQVANRRHLKGEHQLRKNFEARTGASKNPSIAEAKTVDVRLGLRGPSDPIPTRRTEG